MGLEKKASDDLRSEERYAIAARAANDGLWDWDLKTNEVYFSPRWKSMLGLGENEVGNSPDEWLGRVHSKDLGRLLGKLSDHLHRGTAHFESEHRVLHHDGAYRWMRSRGIAVRGEEGEALRMVGWQTDITDRKLAEDRLKHGAWHDPLTDLPNRAYFRSQLQRTAAQSHSRPDRLFALLFLDLDHFKEINDRLGHGTGDQLLIAFAKRLRHSVRPGDIIARLGGDEFAILLKNLNEEGEASHIAARIRRDLAHPFKVDDQEVPVGVSIGIALSTSSPDKPADLLRNADAAMYRAKNLGRARAEVYQSDRAGSDASEPHYLEGALKRAFDEAQFRVHYQPVVALPSGQVVACEALLRWQHPEKGLIPPAEFLPVAEEIGLIRPLGEWLLRAACEQVKQWEDSGLPAIRVSVNLSGRELGRPDLFEKVSATLTETGLEPTRLRLEVTESAILSASAATVQQIEKLSGTGIEIALDNFRMGYSSLIYLRRFPIRTLKLDGFYIRELTTDASDATMAAGVIALAHSLGLRMAAVQVETPEQLEFLRSEECDELQGDVASPPLSREEFAEFLRLGWEHAKHSKAAAGTD